MGLSSLIGYQDVYNGVINPIANLL